MPTPLEQIQYGFDRDSRRTWKRRALAAGEDDHYRYDALSQVTAAARGNLNLNRTAIGGRPASEQSWDYDPTGNWLTVSMRRRTATRSSTSTGCTTVETG